MRFRTFRILGALAFLCLLVAAGSGIRYLLDRPAAPPQPEQVVLQRQPQQAPPLPAVEHAPTTVNTESIRTQIESWLQANPDRQEKMKLINFLPNASFRATAIRFSEKDAGKWSDDSRQWSQIRLDLNRDGTDDEKWLLKNGHTYKRETLDRSGKVIEAFYF